MPAEPAIKRVVAFVDGQNLYRSAKTAFGYHYPNYDVQALARTVCAGEGWQLDQVRFYTGIPDVTDNAFWNHFWNAKFAQMGRQGVHVFWRLLRYRNESVHLPDGTEVTVLVGREKGVDVRLALDVVRLASRHEYDIALVFSQDQDLSEVAERNPPHIPRARPLAQNSLCLPRQPRRAQTAWHQRHRLDQNGPRNLRCLPGHPRLPPQAQNVTA